VRRARATRAGNADTNVVAFQIALLTRAASNAIHAGTAIRAAKVPVRWFSVFQQASPGKSPGQAPFALHAQCIPACPTEQNR
jgi:hypothetical protein